MKEPLKLRPGEVITDTSLIMIDAYEPGEYYAFRKGIHDSFVQSLKPKKRRGLLAWLRSIGFGANKPHWSHKVHQ